MKNKTAFLIEDNHDLLEMFSSFLDSAGIEHRVFNCPLVALEALKSTSPSVIITDSKMPKVSSLELIKKVREIKPAVPIVFITGVTSNETSLELVNAGAFAVLEKPVAEHEYRSTVKQAMSFSKQQYVAQQSLETLIHYSVELGDHFDNISKPHLKDELQDKIEELNKLQALANSCV